MHKEILMSGDKTSYMWHEILTKENILEWIEKYIVNEK